MTLIEVQDAPVPDGIDRAPPRAGGPRSVDLPAAADIAARVAADHAGAVDAEGRFPAEAMDELRRQRLLGMAVPAEFGGGGASVGEVMDVCYRLGRACSSTGMIFAMHQTKVACVVAHGHTGAWHRTMLRRLTAEQLLLASSTTEGQNGGNVRSSAAAVEDAGAGEVSLDRAATVISYGAQADGIVTTARRGAGAQSSDQVLLVLLKENYSLERTGGWDTLGMRGTCSAGFALRARCGPEQVLPEGYDRIHARTMTPVAHLLWSSVWTGIAAAAVDRAQRFIRKAMRGAGGQLPPGAAHYTKAAASLRTLRALINAERRRYEAALADDRLLGSLDVQTALTMLKVDASELAVATVLSALRACGLSGYRNDGDASVTRLLRDVLSSPLMINNDRILSSLATTSLMSGVPASILD